MRGGYQFTKPFAALTDTRTKVFTAFLNRYALRTELTWPHYRLLMRVDEPQRREFYLKESAESSWTSRQL